MTAPDALLLMVEEARLALEARGRGEMALFEVHRANARRIADELDLSATPERKEVTQ